MPIRPGPAALFFGRSPTMRLAPRGPAADAARNERQRGNAMSIDFEIPPEAKAVRERVRQWVQDECIPAEKKIQDKASYKQVLSDLRTKARAQGLWLPFVPNEYGGMGPGPPANALVQMEARPGHPGAPPVNSQGPDDATILNLPAHR